MLMTFSTICFLASAAGACLGIVGLLLTRWEATPATLHAEPVARRCSDTVIRPPAPVNLIREREPFPNRSLRADYLYNSAPETPPRRVQYEALCSRNVRFVRGIGGSGACADQAVARRRCGRESRQSTGDGVRQGRHLRGGENAGSRSFVDRYRRNHDGTHGRSAGGPEAARAHDRRDEGLGPHVWQQQGRVGHG